MAKLNSINVPHLKNTENCETVILALPSKVRIPMAMSMGKPCNPLVKPGDEVNIGQLIGSSDEYFSIPVHSSISGKVTAVTDYPLVNGSCKAVEIETSAEQKLSADIKPPVIKNKDDFLKAVRSSGICGLGGAGFPTHIKLAAKTKIDTLIINAAECEPYITSDYREIIEHSDDLIGGINLVLEQVGIPKAIIAIESNKPEAIKLLNDKCKDSKIQVLSLPPTYPQGAEKVIIYSATGRIIMENELPSDHGVIVMNVSTAAFLKRYFDTGIPLTKRRITIEGDCVKKPCNVEAVIGTPVSELLEYAETDKDKFRRCIAGGLMMGMPLVSPETSVVVKTSNAVLALSEQKAKPQTSCIRCGCCIRVCPLRLMPTEIEKAYRKRDTEMLVKQKTLLCMNCGCCTYSCPAGIKLSESIQLAKSLIPKK